MASPTYNGFGQYKLRLPGEKKAKGRTRATTFIKALDIGDGLIDWKATACMVGTLRMPSLHAKWAALFAESTDPWYAGDDTKKRAKALVEECAKAGGAENRSSLGTALHEMLELVARGRTPMLVDPYAADVKVWQDTLAAAAIVPDPQWCEVAVYVERYDVVGTFDGLVRIPGDDRHVISDNKTEASTDYKALSHAAQLAMYSLATHAIVWPEDPEAECTLVELPPRNTDTGLIIHLPAGEARCTLWGVDLNDGREALEVAARLRGYDTRRKRKDHGGLMKPWATAPIPGDLPARTVNPELAAAEPAEVERIVARTKALDPLHRSVLDAWTKQSGITFRPWTVRTAAIANTMVSLATDTDGDDNIVRHMIAIILGYEPQASVATAALFAALNTDEARRLERLSTDIGDMDSGVMLTFDADHGTPVVLGGIEPYQPAA